VGIESIGSAWKTDIRTGLMPSRDYRLYADPRGFEYPDLGTGSASYTVAREDNLIDRGNCELPIAPMMFGETVPVTTRCTFARSGDFSHTGDYSYKFTKTAAAPTNGYLRLTDSADAGDMHGTVAGSSYTLSFWVYTPTTGGMLPSEISIGIGTNNGGGWIETLESPTGLDAWEQIEIDFTVPSDTTGFVISLVGAGAATANEFFYIDDIRLTTHNIPGSHYLSSGYTEHLLAMPDKFTMQIKFKPTFAFDTAFNQGLWEWQVSATQYLRIFYAQGSDVFAVAWYDGGAQRLLLSAQYDAGASHRNINQEITLTLAFDSTTGDTTGSALWMSKTQDDTAWSGNIDAKSTEFNKLLIRRVETLGQTGNYDIAYVRFFDGLVATDAQVQNDFKTVKDEEIYFSFNGYGTGRTRCNISEYMVSNSTYRGKMAKLAASQGANTFDFRLKNLAGEFSDDQNAAWDPGNSVYNGTDSQNYLQRRFGVMYESWYSGDFDTVFKGRLGNSGLVRSSLNENISYVTGSATDGIGDIDRSIERYGRVYEDLMLVRSDTLIDRGSCESSTPPAMFGETSNTLSNATFARSDAQIYKGRYAYLGTKTIAAGTAATIALSDSTGAGDLHGFLAGETYTLKMKVYIPSGAMLGSEFVIAIVDSVGSDTQAATNTYDVWQEITVERTINGGATYAYPQIQIASATANAETFYADDIRLIPDDLTEANSRSLFHQVSHRSDRKQLQFLANNSFENATIGNSWLVSAGGAFTKVAGGLFGSNDGRLVPGLAQEQAYQTVTFTGSKKLNVGETYNFSVFLKSTAAATAVNNYISIREKLGSSLKDNTSQAYDLAGGEGYMKIEVSHTITDSDSDRLQVVIGADAGDTIFCDGAMLIQSDRALDYFEENTEDGTAGVTLAESADEISWPWFGINAGNADYIHPWRRQEMGTTDWTNVKSIANALAPRYTGMDEAGTLTLKAVLDKDYESPVISDMLSGAEDFRQNIAVTLDGVMGNKFIGYGDKYQKGEDNRLIWLASGTGNFTGAEGDQQIKEPVADDGYFPDPDDYPEYWATYGDAGDVNQFVTRELTIIPDTLVWSSAGTAITHSTSTPSGGSGQARAIASRTTTSTIIHRPDRLITASKSDNIIGIKDADLFGKLEDTGDGTWNVTEVSSGTLVNGLDITSRAGQARILIKNDLEGAAINIMDMAIIGKPVFKFTGAEGYTHDSFVDYDSISKDGEMVIEFGGEDVIDGSAHGQLDRLADFFWKDRKDRKHIYTLSMTGDVFDIAPAQWYRLTAGSAGKTENIDSTVEVLSVRTEHIAGSLGHSIVTFREVQENWKPDSNALARFIARGVPISKPSTGAVVSVGSEYYIGGTTDYRVSIGGTSAEDEINAAIDFVSGTYGGGTVLLTQGTFKTDGSIILKENVSLMGSGIQTIIESTATDAIQIPGGAGTEIVGVKISDLQIKPNDISTSKGIDADYADGLTIDNILITEGGGGIDIQHCDGVTLSGITANNFITLGILTDTTTRLNISDCIIDGKSRSGNNHAYGVLINSDDANLSNIQVSNILGSINNPFGLSAGGDRNSLSNITIKNITSTDTLNFGLNIPGEGSTITSLVVDDVDNTSGTPTNAYGVFVFGDDNVISGYYITNGSGTGVITSAGADRTMLSSGRSTNNGTNYTDSGTNTQISSVDNT